MNPVDAIVHLERCEKAEEAGMVGTVEQMRRQPYMETLRHFCNFACQVNIVMLGTIGQTVTAVVQVVQYYALNGWMMVTDCIDEW